MELIVEFLVEIVFRRIIVGVFGYYTLLVIYTLFGYNKGLEWLQNPLDHEGEEIGRGCLISIVGLISFALLICSIVYLFY
jgi:hypothetical protein